MHVNWNFQIIYGYFCIDQPQSDKVVSGMITFQIIIILVKKWKHGIGPNNIITFNEEFDFLSTPITKPVKIEECSYKNVIVIFIKKILKKQLCYR